MHAARSIQGNNMALRLRVVRLWTGLGLAAVVVVMMAGSNTVQAASTAATAPVLVRADEWQRMANAEHRPPLFAHELEHTVRRVRAAMQAGIHVPVPKDPGGGATHEQHKRNYIAIKDAGTLYRLTGDRAYADFARDLLLAYAKLYPTLGKHPASGDQYPGRLFWQVLNDSVWLVYAIQGYDAIRDTLSVQDRQNIDDNVFRRMAHFLSDESPQNFDLIHNHATWAVAGVGMTGYVLRDRDLVDKALLGLHKDGKAGFLRQIDLLFSPDGYYEEGPYYQRYALQPFVIFAAAIERNDPQRKIFEYKDGVLLKAVDALVQSSYAGLLFPINDALLDKGLDSEEIVTGVDITYAHTHDAGLLSIAHRQNRVLLTPDGLETAQAVAAGKEQPFTFRSILLRDGPDGTRGGLAILREGGERGQALVMKNTMQGMGHGHFDRLNWLFFDNGQCIVSDYGSARFLNVEAKSGGIYLPENKSWAKTTVAHNTLVVDEQSQFGANWQRGEELAPTKLRFEHSEGLQLAGATMEGAYPGVVFNRTLALVDLGDGNLPVVVDLLHATSDKPARFDLPLHFNGHIITQGFAAERHVDTRPVFGKANGYQHLWVDSASAATSEPRYLSWLLDGRFYTYRFGASVPTRAYIVESGANDPNFNLRREPALILRADGAREATFFAVLEPHGKYDGTAEFVSGAAPRVRSIEQLRGDDGDVIVLHLAGDREVAVAIADSASAGVNHTVVGNGRRYAWQGGSARILAPVAQDAQAQAKH